MTTIQMWDKVPGMCEEVPVLEYYPAENKKTDATCVIFPGGGYGARAPHEGKGTTVRLTLPIIQNVSGSKK